MKQIFACLSNVVVVAANFWRQISYYLVGVVVGGVDNPARTGVALHVLILDELNTPREHFSALQVV